jgi:hypothetical protein
MVHCVAGLQLMLKSQKADLADKEVSLKALRDTSNISIITVQVAQLTGIPNFKTVETITQQYKTNKHLKILEYFSIEARNAIKYEANRRNLADGVS